MDVTYAKIRWANLLPHFAPAMFGFGGCRAMIWYGR